MRAAPRKPAPYLIRGLPAYLLPALALLALAAALLWLQPADPARAQDEPSGPTITAGPTITSSPQSGDTYRQGEAIAVALTFSEPVSVNGKPRIRLKIGDQKRWAGYAQSSEDGATLSFTHAVKADDQDADGIAIGKNQLKLNKGSIADADGNAAKLKHPKLSDQAAHKVDGAPDEPPSITRGPILNNPQSGETYGVGEEIVVSLTFSESVAVSGHPRLGLIIGENRRWAKYEQTATDGATLVFAYEVKADDQDDDGISIGKNALRLNGGSIEDGDGKAADLKHPAVADRPTHKVDGSAGEEQQADSKGVCDRTERVQHAILDAMLRPERNCARVTHEDLSSITYLELIWDLPSLRAGDLQGLTNLETLNLSYNKLTALPEDVFDGLTNLEVLALQENRLEALQQDVFDGLTNLEALNLSDNKLTALPEGVFDGLESLESLAMNDNPLTALPEGVFDGLESLESLALSETELKALPEDVFDDLTNLQKLYLFGNRRLSALPEDVFDDLPNLRVLYLVGNKRLSALPEGMFDGLTNLQNLRLDGNKFTVLPKDVFDGLTNLEQLVLQSNKLTTLPEGMFDGLASLRRLDLQGNELNALPEGMFDGLTNLRKLYLYGNPGSPFILNAQLERSGSDGVVVTVAEGAPFPINVTLSAQGGTLSDTTVTIAAGETTSAKITATPNGQEEVTVSVQSAAFPASYRYIDHHIGPGAISLRELVGTLENNFNGVQVGLGTPLVLP